MVFFLLISFLFFFPFFPEMYQAGKFILLSFGTIGILIAGSIQLFRSLKIRLPASPAVYGFGTLAAASTLTLLTTSSNKAESVTDPAAGMAIFVILTVLLAASDLYGSSKNKANLTWGFIGIIGVLYLISLYMLFGIGKIIFARIPYLQDPLWNPVGTPMVLVAIGIIALPLTIEAVIRSVKKKHEAGIAVGAIAGIIFLVGSILILLRVFPTLRATVEPTATAWNILLETYKSPAGLFFGAGIDNYLTAFTLGKPAALNLTDIWNLRFTSAPNSVLHVATTMGIIGTLALFACIAVLIASVFKANDWGLRTSMILAILSLFLVPPHISIWVTLLIVTILMQLDSPKTPLAPEHAAWLPFAVGSLGIIVSIVLLYLMSRFTAGEIAFKTSLDAAAANNGTATYNTQIKAIRYNPTKTNFHMTFSQTNLALANSIASNATQEQPLSATDRSLVSEMLRLAIAEAKIATAMSPKNILVWENLANVYQSITGVVTGADQWALSAYQQSVLLDPTNPLQRMNLAGMYIRLSRYEDAISQLQVAAILNPNLANIHYNLANVYGLTKQYNKQVMELKQTLTLIPGDSEDAVTVKKALEEVYPLLSQQERSSIPEVSTGAPPENQPPLIPIQQTPFPTIEPQIVLPETASPSAGTPIPSPTTTPDPSPTP
jgi:Flp pilus assembly protein TadD